ELRAFSEEDAWSRRSEAEDLLAERLATATSAHWLEVLDAADVWCAPVLTLEQLVSHDGFAAIEMVQKVERSASLTRAGEPLELKTTRSPIRIDGQILVSDMASPKLGQHDAGLDEEFGWTGREVTRS
ncbi:MAG TPA: CoA transferase, partial [Brevibacterium sp.]|nr:CoA transferase [Brevibacterium sp.]